MADDPARREPGVRRRQLPALTIATVGVTALVTMLSRSPGSHLQASLERDPVALSHGQWWRVLSPVLVQTDPAVWQLLGAWTLATCIGVFTEGKLGRLRAGALLLTGALAGNAAGYAFHLEGGGVSVAAFGQLGGLTPWFLRAGPRQARIAGGVIVTAAVTDLLAWRDHHGAAALAGAVIGLWVTRDLPPVESG